MCAAGMHAACVVRGHVDHVLVVMLTMVLAIAVPDGDNVLRWQDASGCIAIAWAVGLVFVLLADRCRRCSDGPHVLLLGGILGGIHSVLTVLGAAGCGRQRRSLANGITISTFAFANGAWNGVSTAAWALDHFRW